MSEPRYPGRLDDLLDEFEHEWVALITFTHEGRLYEAGGVYADAVVSTATRRYDPAEPVADCPACGQLFAATEEGSPELHRDLHFFGDKRTPSICVGMLNTKPDNELGTTALDNDSGTDGQDG